MSNGCLKWRNRPVSVSAVLIGEDVGLEEIDDEAWAVYVGPLRVGTLDERRARILPAGRCHDGREPAVASSR